MAAAGMGEDGRGKGGMQQRIDRLESMVTELMKQGQLAAPAPDLSPMDGALHPEKLDPASLPLDRVDAMPAVQHGMGVMTVNGASSMYRGTTHWHDLLKELDDLKSYWGQVQDEDENESDLLQDSPGESSFEGPSLFCGIVQPIGMSEILASLPSKPACDRLMVRFWDEENSPVPTFSMHFQVQATISC